MSRIAPIFSDRVRYIISHVPTGRLKVKEPVGWRDDDNNFERHKVFHGIMPMVTSSLVFYSEGRDFIKGVYTQYGINADLRLTKDERNPITDIWTRVQDGLLDLTTYSFENHTVSVKFVSSTLLKTIKSRENEKLELERIETFSGKSIPELQTELVALNGRNILLKSKLVTDPEASVTSIEIRDRGKVTNQGILGIPIKEEFASNISVITIPAAEGKASATTSELSSDVQQLFFGDSGANSNMTLSIKGSTNILVNRHPFFVENAVGQIRLVKYNNSTDYDFSEVIFSQDIGNLDNNSNLFVSIDINPNIDILIGDSLSLQVFIKGGLGTNIGQEGWLRYSLSNIDFTVNIEEDSFFDSSQSKFLLPYEVCSRFLNIITDSDDLLISDSLGRTDLGHSEDGYSALVGMTHGFWVRKFDSLPVADDNRFKPLTSTFKEFYESYFSVMNLGLGIEKIGFKEMVRIEDLAYFYNRNVLIDLGKEVDGKFQYIQVSNVKRTINTKAFNSGLDIGYTKGGDYEEAVGLDEYNTRTTFTTIIDKLDQTFLEVSKYRADSYGMEFCRRFPFEDYPTEDTHYDKSVWLMDLKRGVTDVFEQRLWQDDFEKEPTGVFSPETAQNLRLSPFNILLRHGWDIASGLLKYAQDFIRYSSSVSNSKLKTQLIGGVEYAEDGNIQNKDLESARMNGEIIEFDYEVDFDLLQKVQGKTVILGKEIPNFYGLVAFKNEDGIIEKGYLQKLAPNGVGKWTLLKYNG